MAATESVLIDSNVVIYTALPEYGNLREWLRTRRICISDITRLEVLGYHALTIGDKAYFERFFSECNIVPIDGALISKAIELRRTKSMSLGDSIIAASSLQESISLLTANIKDFDHIGKIEIIDILEI